VQLDWTLFISVFSLIFLAELPDKTAFAVLLMSTRGNIWAIFYGVAAAFAIQSLVAVSLGGFLSALPATWVHGAAALLFLGFAVAAWLKRDEEPEAETQKEIDDAESKSMVRAMGSQFWATAWKSFLVIFVAEWGDLTQLATASMAARYREFHKIVTIFIASTSALWAVTLIAIIVGNHARKWIKPALMQRFAAAAFALVGIYFLAELVLK
jgi:putative Ca2+/H+ antiporter (TMEM165/GDT1 family)